MLIIFITCEFVIHKLIVTSCNPQLQSYLMKSLSLTSDGNNTFPELGNFQRIAEIDQASRVLEQINCSVASVGGAQLLMEVVAGSSCCNVA